jgi:hypothetical protein
MDESRVDVQPSIGMGFKPYKEHMPHWQAVGHENCLYFSSTPSTGFGPFIAYFDE